MEAAEGRRHVRLVTYRGSEDIPLLCSLIERDLSEPYSTYTYRYFLDSWPQFGLLAMESTTSGASKTAEGEVRDECIGCVVCKLDRSRHGVLRGYIAMLAVRHDRRQSGLGTLLVETVLMKMHESGCEEVVLEAELSNRGALALYEKLGFVRDKLLEKYYLNGSSAYRLKLKMNRRSDSMLFADMDEDAYT
ncbi:N-alpha-acetyltransferase 30 [Porphyridium purpureum]|uniref:N-alpha-acetyltransferase 30 n=1 Tax=Porphyridium purpureum TaxID=35688 RepID=A0A5J4YNX3_PORPP|nr:N-alpha-acetyltransferase 30 [Porphyridium purpureum]|eukprot:POR8872..scf295_9